MSKTVKATLLTPIYSSASSAAQRSRPGTANAVARTDPTKIARPNSRGTPSRSSNNSRGPRVSEDRPSRSIDDADEHSQWLSIPIEPVDGDLQSFQSVTLDASGHQQMMNLVERQRTNSKMSKLRSSSGYGAHELTPHNSASDLLQQVQLERQYTIETDLTFESDDYPSDRTTTAHYMHHERGSPNKDGSGNGNTRGPVELRRMSDEQLEQMEAFIRAERMRRKQQFSDIGPVDPQALEARKSVRRSKSGGSEAAFSRKYSTSPGHLSFSERKTLHSGDLNSSFARLSHHDVIQEPEDPELSAYSTQSAIEIVPAAPTPSNYPQSPANGRIGLSRGNGAIHPGSRMFENSLFHTTPSPATTAANTANNGAAAASSSHASTATQFLNSPTQHQQYNQSPIQEWHSRPSSRSMTGLLHTASSHYPPSAGTSFFDEQRNNHENDISGNAHNGSGGGLSLALPSAPSNRAVINNFSSIEGDDDNNKNFFKPNNNKKTLPPAPPSTSTTVHPHHHRNTLSRELVLSPSCAFDDISLGSQKSLNSSRSSRTRVVGENGLELSPTTTFAKHQHSNTTGGVKKTIQSSTDLPKKAKKN